MSSEWSSLRTVNAHPLPSSWPRSSTGAAGSVSRMGRVATTFQGWRRPGRIVAVGEGVTGLAVGDEVAAYLSAFGGYAQFAVTAADFVRGRRVR